MPSLVVVATLQAVAIGAVSNVLAQLINAIQKDGPFTLDVSPLLFFMIFNLISCPPNVLWQIYLEERYPSDKVDQQGHKSLDKVNLVKKLLWDQTVSATANTSGYIAALAAYQGQDLAGVVQQVQKEFWPLMQAGWKMWPMVALLSFAIIPLKHRTLFGSLAGLFWNIFLSLKTTV